VISDKLTNAVLVVCALAVTALAVESRLKKPSVGGAQAPERTVRRWDVYIDSTRTLGAVAPARNELVLFTDYECPFCARFSRTLHALASDTAASVRITVRHNPLVAIHDGALEAAAFAECSREAGRFGIADSVLYARQDAVKGKQWGELAQLAGLTDSLALFTCMKSDAIASIITQDIEAAQRLGVSGTPEFILNGRLISGVLPESQVRERLR
jgi:protein-disulfide isomerase